MATHSYRDLKVWQESMALVESVYNFVRSLPSDEKFSLIDQMRRCTVSVPANIAEGQKRNSKKEFIQFCSIARGSLGELETHLEIANRVYNLDIDPLIDHCERIAKMLTGLVQSIKQYEK